MADTPVVRSVRRPPQPSQDRWRAALYGEPESDWHAALEGPRAGAEFTRGMEAGGAIGKVPFAGDVKEAYDLWDINELAGKVRTGGATEEEEAQLIRWLEEQQKEATWGYVAGSIFANAPKYFVEIMLSGGLYTAAKTLGKRAFAKMASEALQEGAERAIKGLVKSKAGSFATMAVDKAAQAAFSVSTLSSTLTLAETARAQLPDMQLQDAGRLSIAFANSGESFLEALPTGWRRAWSEYFSEMSGALMGKAAGMIPGQQKLVAGMARFWKDVTGTLGTKAFDILEKGGWNGILEELGEERVNDILAAMFGDISWADVIPTREQLAGEVVGIGMFGGAARGAAAGAQALAGAPAPDKAAQGRAQRLEGVVQGIRAELSALDPEADAEEIEVLETALQQAEGQRDRVMSGLPEEAEERVDRPYTEEGQDAVDLFRARNEELGGEFEGEWKAVEPTTPEDKEAVERFDAQGVDLVLADPGEGVEVGRTAMFRAAAEGRRAQVVVSMRAGARARTRALFLHELLHQLYRSQRGSWEAVRALIEQADPGGLQLAGEAYERSTGKPLPAEILGEEAVSKYVELLAGWLDNVATDPRSLAESQAGRSLLVRIADALVEILRRAGFEVRSTEARELARRLEEVRQTDYEKQLDPAVAMQLARDIQSVVESATKPQSEAEGAPADAEKVGKPEAEPAGTVRRTVKVSPEESAAAAERVARPAPVEAAEPREEPPDRTQETRPQPKAAVGKSPLTGAQAKRARQRRNRLEKKAREARARGDVEAAQAAERTLARGAKPPSPAVGRREVPTAAAQAARLYEEGEEERFAAAPGASRSNEEWDRINSDLAFWDQEVTRSAGLDEDVTEAARVAALGVIARSAGPARTEETANAILDRLLKELGRDADEREYFTRAMQIGREMSAGEERFAARPRRPFPPPKDSEHVKGGVEGNVRRKLASKKRYDKIPKGSVDPKDIRGTGAHKIPRKVLRLDPKKLAHVFNPKGAARWVVGKITTLDWWKRVSSVLSPEEIAEARRWYEKVVGAFEAGDENLIAAWLMANQQVAPWMALLNALRVREYVLSRQPREKKLEGGLQKENLKELWTRVRDLVPTEEMDTKGISRKLYDFIDSALGYETRAWMGDDARGGEPAVIDVHTSRDVGFVDPTLWTYLEKLGVPRAVLEALAKDKPDFDMAQVDDGVLTGGAPSSVQYERGAEFLHEVRDYLNKRGLGGERWERVAEVQAVGWMALLKLFKLEADTPEGTVAKGTKTVAAAVMFGEGAPYSAKFPELATLPYEGQARVTDRVGRVAAEVAREALGGWPYLLSAEVGQGTWGLYAPEPAIIFRVMATPEGTDAFADSLGYLLQQTEVRHERALAPTPGGAAPNAANEYFVEVYAHELGDDANYLEAWRTISKALPELMAGSHPVVHPDGTPGMRIGVTRYKRRKGESKEAFAGRSKGGYASGKVGLAALEADIARALEGVPFEARVAVLYGQVPKREILVEGEPQVVNQSRNDWKENTDGQSYLGRLGSAWGPEIPARLRDRGRARVEAALAEALREELDGERYAADPRWGTDAWRRGRLSEAGRERSAERYASRPRVSGGEHFQSTGGPVHNWGERRVSEWVDMLYPLKELQQRVKARGGQLDERIDTYLAHELRRGRTKARLEAFKETYIDPIVKLIGDNKLDMQDVRDYLVARHVRERNTQIERVTALRQGGPLTAGSGHTNAWAAQTLARLNGGAQAQTFQELARRFDAMNEWKLDYMLRSGLVSQEEVDTLRATYQTWAPLRHIDKGEAGFMGLGQGYDTGGRNFERAWGRSSAAEHPLEFAIMLAETAIIRGEKNRVGLRLLDWYRTNQAFLANVIEENLEVKRKYAGPDGLMRERKDPTHELAPNAIRIREDGQVVVLTFNPDYRDVPMALKNYGAQDMAEVTKFIAGTTRTLAALSTRWNPAFTPFNGIRDFLHAGIITFGEHGFAFSARVMRDTVLYSWRALAAHAGMPGLKVSPEWTQAVKDYHESGAPIAFLDLNDIDDTLKRIDRGVKKINAKGVEAFWYLLQDVGHYVGQVNDVVENAARLSAFVNARRPPSAGGLGLSMERAASYAKNLTTNFERKGKAGQRWLSPYYMFANAGIQGTARVAEAAWESPARMSAALTGIMVGGAIMDVVMAAIAGDDELGRNCYDKIPAYVKRSNLVLMHPGGCDATLVPLPFVFNFFWNFGRDGAAMMRGAQTLGETAMSVATSALDSFNPLGGSEDPVQIALPTFAKPFFQHWANKDYLGRSIKPENFPFGVQKPNKDLYSPGAGPTAKHLTRKLHELAYGKDNPLQKGAWDWSPEVLEHYAGWAFGGLGRAARRQAIVGEKLVTGEEIDPSREQPIYRRFAWTPEPWFESREYRAVSAEVRDFEARLEALRAGGMRARASELQREQSALYRLIGPLKDSEKRVRKIRTAISKAPPERTAELEELLQKEYQRFNRRALAAGVR